MLTKLMKEKLNERREVSCPIQSTALMDYLLMAKVIKAQLTDLMVVEPSDYLMGEEVRKNQVTE